MTLSIVIITMNRALQLKEAIESCLVCELPAQTEFIVVDNASTDNTAEIVADIKQNTRFDIRYLKSDKNLGVGGGRNYALEFATGDYIYVLDDDAVISDQNPDFFNDAIKIMEDNPEFASLTTQIYDTAWVANRLSANNLKIKEHIYKYFMPCGGSHFLRRKYYDAPIYYPNLYGYEEIATAVQARDKGYENVFCDNLLVIHKPKVNKWVKSNTDLYINEFASRYAIKSVLYPRVVIPVLWLFYNIRYFKYLKGSGKRSAGAAIIKNLKKLKGDFKRISLSTFFKLYRDFGNGTF